MKTLHHKVVGRKTRSDKTWEIQQRMFSTHHLFCIIEGKMLAGGIFYHNNDNCYYAVSCTTKGHQLHAIIWNAIKCSKALGNRTLEMGEQVFSGDKKHIDISKFKAGFGGRV